MDWKQSSRKWTLPSFVFSTGSWLCAATVVDDPQGWEVKESRRELAESLLYIPYYIDLRFNTVEMRIK